MKEQGQKLTVAGATILVAEPVMQLAHFGGPGVIAGLAAGAIAYLVADEVHQAKQQAGGFSPPAAPVEKKPTAPAQQGLAYRLLNGKSVRNEASAEQKPDQANIPSSGLPRRSPAFAQMKHLIKPDVDILAFDGQKFITGVTFSNSVNMAIIGLPRHGKSTCLRFHVAQALVQNSIIRGWDTHGDVAGEFGERLNVAETVPDILADCAWVEQELARRNALYKRVRAKDLRAIQEWTQLRPILYIVDEFLVLSALKIKNKADRATVTDTLLSLIAEGSKYKIRVILSGQSLPANLFGQTASSLRDIIGTKYAFASEDRQAQMIGIEQKAIEELMPLIAGDDIKGYVIVAGGPLRANILGSIPDTTFEDLQTLTAEYDGGNAEIAETFGNGRNPTETPIHLISRKQEMPISDPKEPVFESGNAEMEDQPPEGVTWEQLGRIEKMFDVGWNAGDVARQVGLSGRKYPLFKSACEYLGIDPRARA